MSIKRVTSGDSQMIIGNYEDVKAFHSKFNIPYPSQPTVMNDEVYNYRVGFLKEERLEFIDAHTNRNYSECIDALLDEMYVVNGTALMMGITPEMWAARVDDFVQGKFDSGNVFTCPNHDYYRDGERFKGPRFLPDAEYNSLISCLDRNILSLVECHYEANIPGMLDCLVAQNILCYNAACQMGLKYFVIAELWADIQRANMEKVRATDESQSKRKSKLDIVKPQGWRPPNGPAILDFHYPQWRNLK